MGLHRVRHDWSDLAAAAAACYFIAAEYYYMMIHLIHSLKDIWVVSSIKLCEMSKFTNSFVFGFVTQHFVLFSILILSMYLFIFLFHQNISFCSGNLHAFLVSTQLFYYIDIGEI